MVSQEEEEEVHPDEGEQGVSGQMQGSLVALHLMHLLRLRF